MKRLLLFKWTLVALLLPVALLVAMRLGVDKSEQKDANRSEEAPSEAEIDAVSSEKMIAASSDKTLFPTTLPASPDQGDVQAGLPGKSTKPALDVARPDLETVQLALHETLAMVNGKGILAGDLVPLAQGKGVYSLSRDEYQHRLTQAIEQALVREAAGQKGIKLSTEQLASLHKIRERYQADIASYQSLGAEWTSVTDEQIDFEVKRAEAILLQQSLLTKSGAPALQPTMEEIEEYYKSHDNEYGPLPSEPVARAAAWGAIILDIRQKMDPQRQAEFLAWEASFIASLKSQAQISIIKPVL